mmetsp:Transcript_34886/g.58344  ORF Transcript_34886/g.58344 Transcript_34886/m.58344 type:complete len:370 (+) Transcript_34886:1167-2276(+)
MGPERVVDVRAHPRDLVRQVIRHGVQQVLQHLLRGRFRRRQHSGIPALRDLLHDGPPLLLLLGLFLLRLRLPPLLQTARDVVVLAALGIPAESPGLREARIIGRGNVVQGLQGVTARTTSTTAQRSSTTAQIQPARGPLQIAQVGTPARPLQETGVKLWLIISTGVQRSQGVARWMGELTTDARHRQRLPLGGGAHVPPPCIHHCSRCSCERSQCHRRKAHVSFVLCLRHLEVHCALLLRSCFQHRPVRFHGLDSHITVFPFHVREIRLPLVVLPILCIPGHMCTWGLSAELWGWANVGRHWGWRPHACDCGVGIMGGDSGGLAGSDANHLQQDTSRSASGNCKEGKGSQAAVGVLGSGVWGHADVEKK